LATKGANAYVIEGKGSWVLVDAGMEKDGAAIASGLAALGLGFKDIRLIVITHAHVDHYGAAAAIRLASGAPVAAHGLEAPFMERGESSPTVAASRFGRMLNRLTEKWRNEPCPVDLLVGDTLDLAPYGVDGRLIATPGHTAGSLSVALGDGTVLAADLIRGKPGKLGFGMFYEDRAAIVESLRAIAALKPRTVCLSHGTAIDASELERFIASVNGKGRN
jgi:glyoxylase-like metal-dependent hydrolase (beta-lactamase superfamily II)